MSAIRTPPAVKLPLTIKRTLIVVIISLAINVVLMTVIGAIVRALISAQQAASPGSFAGLGTALVGGALSVVVGYAASVVTVWLGLRGRHLTGLFTATFAATLIGASLIMALIVRGLDSIAVTPSVIPFESIVAWLVGVPLLWMIPAGIIKVLPWRWVLLSTGIVLELALVATWGLTLKAQFDRQSIVAAYSGPVFAPSSSPASPIDGFTLRQVEVPNAYNTGPGDAAITLFYQRKVDSTNPLGTSFYSLEFSAGTDALLCGGSYSVCPAVGTVRGSKVLFDGSSKDYYLPTDGGVITLSGYLNVNDALTVLNDLKSATVQQVGDLKTVPLN